MTIALPRRHTLSNDAGNRIPRKSGSMSRHQQETLVGRWITEVRRLHGIVERIGILQFAKCFLFDRAKNLRVNIEAATLRQTQGQDGERIVMAREAGALFNERRSRFLEYGQRTLNGFTRVCNGLRRRLCRTEQ